MPDISKESLQDLIDSCLSLKKLSLPALLFLHEIKAPKSLILVKFFKYSKWKQVIDQSSFTLDQASKILNSPCVEKINEKLVSASLLSYSIATIAPNMKKLIDPTAPFNLYSKFFIDALRVTPNVVDMVNSYPGIIDYNHQVFATARELEGWGFSYFSDIKDQIYSLTLGQILCIHEPLIRSIAEDSNLAHSKILPSQSDVSNDTKILSPLSILMASNQISCVEILLDYSPSIQPWGLSSLFSKCSWTRKVLFRIVNVIKFLNRPDIWSYSDDNGDCLFGAVLKNFTPEKLKMPLNLFNTFLGSLIELYPNTSKHLNKDRKDIAMLAYELALDPILSFLKSHSNFEKPTDINTIFSAFAKRTDLFEELITEELALKVYASRDVPLGLGYPTNSSILEVNLIHILAFYPAALAVFLQKISTFDPKIFADILNAKVSNSNLSSLDFALLNSVPIESILVLKKAKIIAFPLSWSVWFTGQIVDASKNKTDDTNTKQITTMLNESSTQWIHALNEQMGTFRFI